MPIAARRALRGGVLGNYVDQFDIFLPVIALAPAAATLYGPNDLARNLGLVFVATLLGRPVGAALFGHLADRVGRTVTTQVTIGGVAATTLALAAVPGHDVLGAGTVALVLALRFVGGVFLGGEYTSAVPLAMEWSPPRRRGLVSGLIMSMSPWANASIAALTLALLTGLGPERYAAWGWRVSFVVGGVLALAMLVYYRTRVLDSPEWRAAPKRTSPLRDILIGDHRRQLAQVFVLMSGLWLFTNMAIPVLTSRLKSAGLPDADVSAVMLVATALSAVAMAACGHLSTLIGRRRFFVGFGALALFAAPGAYVAATAAAGTRSVPLVAVAVAALQVVTVSVYGPVGAYLSERFAAGVRASGYGVGYSLSIVLPALYPFYLPGLEGRLGDLGAVVALLVLAAALVLVGGALGPEPDRDHRLPVG